MIKSRLYEYLKQYLGDYLYGMEQDQLEIALLSGCVNFSNANLKPSKVNELLISHGMPFNLKAGLIGNLSLNFSYAS